MSTKLAGLLLASAVLAPARAHAWGYEGHEIIAEIARAYMTPAALAKVDALLAGDVSNSLTAHDMASEATWADAYRGAGHKETASWHFVDIELDRPDVKSACFGFPPAADPASSGPAEDCIIDKISEFTAELASPANPADERLLALKYVLHFVGDIHQPLHAADNHDRGGNCVSLALGGPRTQNLHGYWDTGVVQAIGSDPVAVSKSLIASITPADVRRWSSGGPKDWAMESFEIAGAGAYTLGSKPGCDGGQGAIPLPPGYAEAARKTASIQLEKAGVRLAIVLNHAFAN
jgi:S1/P1 Nuclease